MELITFKLDSPLLSEFIELSDRYFSDEQYVPCFKASLYQQLNEENPFFKSATYQFFLIKEGNEYIARAMAFIDSRRETSKEVIGSFGFFECPNNQETANFLLSSIDQWLKSQGAHCIEGPMDLNIYTGYRMMVEGFETTPFTTEPRNPRYYPALLESNGFKTLDYWRSWEINQQEVTKFHQFVNMISTKRKDVNELSIIDIHPAELEKTLNELYPVAMEVFSQNYGFSRISKPEFIAIFSGLKPFLEEDSFQVAYNGDKKLVGFMYGLKDFALAFKELNGDHTQIPSALSKKSERYIYHTFGITTDLRFSDATARLTNAQTSKYHQKYPSSIAALTTSNKSIVDRIKKANRRYQMYVKNL